MGFIDAANSDEMRALFSSDCPRNGKGGETLSYIMNSEDMQQSIVVVSIWPMTD